MPYPRFQRARAFQMRERKSTGGGDISIVNTAWAAVDTALDIALDAQSGDVLEAGVSLLWGAQANTTRLEVGLMSGSGSVVGCFGTPTYATNSGGVPGWLAPGGVPVPVNGSIMKTLAGGEIVGGFVTCRLLVRADAGTPIRTLNATDLIPLQFWVKNLGPMDPSLLV